MAAAAAAVEVGVVESAAASVPAQEPALEPETAWEQLADVERDVDPSRHTFPH